MIKEFRDFIAKGNVMDMAVGDEVAEFLDHDGPFRR